MSDKYPPTVQRPALLKLVEALGVRDMTLGRDACGDWCIAGDHGHIYAVPGIPWGGMEKTEGFQFYCSRDTARAWGSAKKLLGFCRVTQDGDTEGMLFIGRFPTEIEAAVIRETLGIRKKRAIGEDERERLLRSQVRFERKGGAHDA